MRRPGPLHKAKMSRNAAAFWGWGAAARARGTVHDAVDLPRSGRTPGLLVGPPPRPKLRCGRGARGAVRIVRIGPRVARCPARRARDPPAQDDRRGAAGGADPRRPAGGLALPPGPLDPRPDRGRGALPARPVRAP